MKPDLCRVALKKRNDFSLSEEGVWSDWSGWSACRCGSQSRTRTCQFDRRILSLGCLGISYEVRSCRGGACVPVTLRPTKPFITLAPGAEHGFRHNTEPPLAYHYQTPQPPLPYHRQPEPPLSYQYHHWNYSPTLRPPFVQQPY